MSFTIPLRGPDGARSRMAEIQSRVESLTAKREPADPVALQGTIGGNDGFAPFSPLSGGATLRSMRAPSGMGPLIEGAARQAGIDPALFDALVATESAYDPSARSSAGAMGLSQLMPATARSLGVANPFDPAQNLSGGARYLAQMLQRFGGDERLALAAYNAGPGAVERFNGIPPYAQTQSYVERVLNLAAERRGR